MASSSIPATEHPTLNPAQLAEINEALITKANLETDLLTLGFTIAGINGQGVMELINNSLSSSNSGGEVLGWFFMFKTKEKIDSDGEEVYVTNSVVNVGDIPIHEMRLNGGSLFTTPLNAVVRPSAVSQKPNPGTDGANDDHATAMSHTDTTFHELLPDKNLPAAYLSYHTNWAEAVFLRRSDLQFLSLYVDTFTDNYDDLFFSGTEVDYGIMHDPQLRRRQFGLDEAVANSSVAFSLKAEPIRTQTFQSRPPADGQTAPGMAGAEQSGVAFPAAAMGLPCPDYWAILRELDTATPAPPNNEETPLGISARSFGQNCTDIIPPKQLVRRYSIIYQALVKDGVVGLTIQPIKIEKKQPQGCLSFILSPIINTLIKIRGRE